MNKSEVKIVFFGTPDFAVPVLKALLDSKYHVSGVFTGHGPIEFWASKNDIKVFNPTSLKKDNVFEKFKSTNPDLCIVAAYGKILPSRYLDIPKYGFLNVHPSVLPKYRGPSPVQTAILNGDKETGVSVMMIDEKVDHGPVLANVPYKIPDSKYHFEIAEDIFELGAQLLIEILPKYLNGKTKPVKQDHNQATFTKMFQKEDGRINWFESGDKIYNQIRALNPEPGTWTTWNNKIINIINATTLSALSPQIINMEDLMSGTVKKINNDIAVAAQKYYIILKSVQLEGGKEMDVKSFVNGHPDFIGSQLV